MRYPGCLFQLGFNVNFNGYFTPGLIVFLINIKPSAEIHGSIEKRQWKN